LVARAYFVAHFAGLDNQCPHAADHVVINNVLEGLDLFLRKTIQMKNFHLFSNSRFARFSCACRIKKRGIGGKKFINLSSSSCCVKNERAKKEKTKQKR
jgi:hypothetical protein